MSPLDNGRILASRKKSTFWLNCCGEIQSDKLFVLSSDCICELMRLLEMNFGQAVYGPIYNVYIAIKIRIFLVRNEEKNLFNARSKQGIYQIPLNNELLVYILN